MSQVPSFFDAVFFDMDGLLVDSEPQWLQSEKEVMAPFGYDWLDSDQVACLGGPLTRVGQYMFEKSGNQKTPDFFRELLIDVQSKKMRAHIPIMPGAIELVRQLQLNGIKTALVSASPRIIVDAVLANVGKNLFPFSISSNDVEFTKPHPDAYLKAATISGVDINNCLVFEDSLTGMKAATSSGAFLIAVPHLVTIDESPRVRVIKSLAQLNYQKLIELKADFLVSI
jgi:HAD superfamily hydrolase (TIGR01509 family)